MRKVAAIFLSLACLTLVFAAPAAAARPGGTLVTIAPYGGDLGGLDLHGPVRFQDMIVGLNIFRSLYNWDPDQGKPVPELFTEATVSPDGLVWIYKLRKDVKFHNGRTMTADDVIYSYTRIMSLKVSSAARFIRPIMGAVEVEQGKAKEIAGLKRLDDFTVQISLKEPVDLSYNLREPNTAIVPREEVEKKGENFKISPVGCGPFEFVKWDRGSQVVLKKFNGFYKPGRPYLDKVVFRIMTEGGPRDMAFRAKELDVNLVGAAQYPTYSQDPELSRNLVEVAEMFTRLVGFNVQAKPFDNKYLRQAWNHAIDKDLINKKLLKGKAVTATGFLPPTSPAYDKDLKGYAYDPQKALELMKKSGLYEKGVTVECIGTSNDSWGVGIFEAVMPFLKKINVNLKIQQMESAMMRSKLEKGEFQAYIWSLSSGPDPLSALARWKSENPRGAGNFNGYKNPEYDKLIALAGAEKNFTQRMDILKKAEALIVEEAIDWIYNYNKAIIAHQPWVHGLKPVAMELMFQEMAGIWVDEKSPRANEK